MERWSGLYLGDEKLRLRIERLAAEFRSGALALAAARSAAEALERLAVEKPDLLLLLHAPPEWDAAALLREVEKREGGGARPGVLFFLGEAGASPPPEAAGAEALVVEALTPALLELACRAAVRRAALEAQVRELERRLALQAEAASHEREAEKMGALARFAGALAHGYNNMLAVVNGYSEILLQQETPDPRSRQALEAIRQAGERAAQLTRQLLAFSCAPRQAGAGRNSSGPAGPEGARPIDLGAVALRARPVLRSVLGEGVELVFHFEQPLGLTSADPEQIRQILVELAANARDAMPEGGVLTIEARNVDIPPAGSGPEERSAAGIPPGPYVLLTVSDTGHGMDAETQSRLFEPFFTTKRTTGEPLGLGLTLVYIAVEQLGGQIRVYSVPGKGTTFRIYLPRLPEPASRPAPAGAARETAGAGGGTLLVADDEPMVRDLLRQILQLHGYTVLEAASAEEAEQLAARHSGRIDLLVADLLLPGGGGTELAERLRAVRPELRVLFLSGYPDEGLLRAPAPEAVPWIEKPFKPPELVRKVRELLEEKTPGRAGKRETERRPSP